MGDPVREDITKQLTFGIQHPDGRDERKTIYPIADDELADYVSLGRGTAEPEVFPAHAIYQAFRHVPDFFHRAAGYRLGSWRDTEMLSDATGRAFVSIEFFERVGTDHDVSSGPPEQP